MLLTDMIGFHTVAFSFNIRQRDDTHHKASRYHHHRPRRPPRSKSQEPGRVKENMQAMQKLLQAAEMKGLRLRLVPPLKKPTDWQKGAS